MSPLVCPRCSLTSLGTVREPGTVRCQIEGCGEWVKAAFLTRLLRAIRGQ